MKVKIEQFPAKKKNIVGEEVPLLPDQFVVVLLSDDEKVRRNVGYCWKSSGNFRPIKGLEADEREMVLDAVEKHAGKKGDATNFQPLDIKESVNVDEESNK